MRKTQIKRFFAAYLEEVREHFEHEETTVYPHIGRLVNHESGDNFMIKSYLDTHDSLEDKLSDLVQIIFKYLPASPHQEGYHTPPVSPSILEGELATSSNSDDDSIDMVFDILQLSHDLRKHSLIEEKILGPYVKHLEKTAAL